jgi:hypothetical protein
MSDECVYREMLYLTRSIQLNFWIYTTSTDPYYYELIKKQIDGLTELVEKIRSDRNETKD